MMDEDTDNDSMIIMEEHQLISLKSKSVWAFCNCNIIQSEDEHTTDISCDQGFPHL